MNYLNQTFLILEDTEGKTSTSNTFGILTEWVKKDITSQPFNPKRDTQPYNRRAPFPFAGKSSQVYPGLSFQKEFERALG